MPCAFFQRASRYIATITHTMNFKFASTVLPLSVRTARLASVAALVCALGTLSIGQAVAQSQPQSAPAQGQMFEEEIVPQRYANNPNVDAFINDLVARYDFDSASLHDLFNRVSYSATAVKLVCPRLRQPPRTGARIRGVSWSRYALPPA
jgi:membrane-bound lytic murein transglycosylase B